MTDPRRSLQEERELSRQRQRTDTKVAEFRARTVRGLAEPGANRTQLEDAARAQYPRLTEEERAEIVNLATEAQERDRNRERTQPGTQPST